MIRSAKNRIRRFLLVSLYGTKFISVRDLFKTDKQPDNYTSTIYWLGCFPPWQRNIGDHAQTYAISGKIRATYPNHKIRKFCSHEVTPRLLEEISRSYQPNDLIIVNGNGDFGDVYLKHPSAMSNTRRLIAHKLCDCRIIFLPSTVFYRNTKNNDREIFDRENFTILCRGPRSKEILQSIGLKGTIYPDVVFWMAGAETPQILNSRFKEAETNRKMRALVLLRPTNMESRLNREDHQFIINTTREQGFCTQTSDIHYANCPIYPYMYKKLFLDLFSLYRKFDLIVTDRMHAMIFASILGIRCVAIQNAIPHKLNEHKGLVPPFINFCDNLADLSQSIKDVQYRRPFPIDIDAASTRAFREVCRNTASV